VSPSQVLSLNAAAGVHTAPATAGRTQRSILRRAVHITLASEVGWSARSLLRHPGVIVITYHRIGPTSDGLPGLEVDHFREHMEWIRARCTPIAARELRSRADSPPRRRPAVLVTFDDGYRDYRELAYPILSALGIPALVFVATAYIDEPTRLFWWEALTLALRRTRVPQIEPPWQPDAAWPLGTDDARQRFLREAKRHLKGVAETAKEEAVRSVLARLGVEPPQLAGERRMLTWDDVRATRDITEFGGHSHTHTILSRLDAGQLEAEVRQCRERLEAETGQPPRFFAYPNGKHEDFDDSAKAALRRHGFEMAFSTLEGTNGPATDWMAVRRFPGHGDASALAWELAGFGG
jgi:peptidoglycan/xylan/chitin deacetylase (PgdA/CDA1 family)